MRYRVLAADYDGTLATDGLSHLERERCAGGGEHRGEAPPMS